MRETIKTPMVEQYVLMACRHANKVREADGLAKNGVAPPKSCRFMSTRNWDIIRDAVGGEGRMDGRTAIKRVLDAYKITQQNFRELDYLLIPVLDQGHYVLYAFGMFIFRPSFELWWPRC